jgi:hypothetical protein
MTPGSVSYEDGWRRFESKTLEITVLDADGAAVDLSTAELRFVVVRQHGGTPIVEKLSTGDNPPITVSGADDNVAVIAFESPDDYANLPAGVYQGELWDTDASLMLWPRPGESGDLYLSDGVAPPEEEEE